MGRRGCDVEANSAPEPLKKRSRTISECCEADKTLELEQPLPKGEILTDVTQKQWRIGKPIGRGSFGEIYLASDDIEQEADAQTARYVIKIEPHSNGPLFVEIHCLIRTAKHSMIKQWQSDKKLQSLGMPHYIASGSHTFADTRYRFLVLPRYQSDLQKLSTSSFGRIRPENVLVLAAQIIDILEYLHVQGYAHSDIKSSNLMIGFNGKALKTQRLTGLLTNNAANSTVTSGSDRSENECKKSAGRPDKQPPKNLNTGYYADKDFVLYSFKSNPFDSDMERDRVSRASHPKTKRLLRMMRDSNKGGGNPGSDSEKGSRPMRLFNLRKASSGINYEDAHSSICSDGSYQGLLDTSAGNDNTGFYSSDEGFHEESKSSGSFEIDDSFEEAISTQSSGQVYLLDYGLASKFINSNGSHKEFGMDQRKAHDGTLEYSSRDSHIGAHSRRSDLENLGYNILDWLTANLPWKTPNMLANPDLVHALKKNCMKDIKGLLEACFKSHLYPEFLQKYFHYITTLEFNQKPDYKYCKSLFVTEFNKCGFGEEKDMVLNFAHDAGLPPKKKINYSKKIKNSRSLKNTSPEFLKRNGISKVLGRENFIISNWENDFKVDMDYIRDGLNISNDGIRKPCVSRNFYVSKSLIITNLRQSLLPMLDTPSKKFSPKNLRSKKVVNKKRGAKNKRSSIGKFGNFLGSGKQYTWAEILAGNPEDIIRKVDKEKTCQSNDASSEVRGGANKKIGSRKVSNASEFSSSEVDGSSNLLHRDFLTGLNPTYAMKEVVANYKRKVAGKSPLKNDQTDFQYDDESAEGYNYTYAMLRVLKMKENRLKRERLMEEKELKKQKQAVTPKPSKRSNSRISETKTTNVKLDNTRNRKIKSVYENKVTENVSNTKNINVKTVKVPNKLNTRRDKPAIVTSSNSKNSKVTKNKACSADVTVISPKVKQRQRKACSKSNSSDSGTKSTTSTEVTTSPLKRVTGRVRRGSPVAPAKTAKNIRKVVIEKKSDEVKELKNAASNKTIVTKHKRPFGPVVKATTSTKKVVKPNIRKRERIIATRSRKTRGLESLT